MATTTKTDARQHSGEASGVIKAVIFGLIFGFLLQKGGVAKYHLLIGVLLLQDFTVVKIMLSAITVGMIGFFALSRLGLIKPMIKPTRYGANIVGGLIFGAGFALSGYCPGTAAAALGQTSWDALFVIAGMIAGSWIFAEMSGWLGRTIQHWGDRGKLLLPEALHIRPGAFIAGFATLLVLGLLLIERLDAR